VPLSAWARAPSVPLLHNRHVTVLAATLKGQSKLVAVLPLGCCCCGCCRWWCRQRQTCAHAGELSPWVPGQPLAPSCPCLCVQKSGNMAPSRLMHVSECTIIVVRSTTQKKQTTYVHGVCAGAATHSVPAPFKTVQGLQRPCTHRSCPKVSTADTDMHCFRKNQNNQV
jgi:hypothetical protein